MRAQSKTGQVCDAGIADQEGRDYASLQVEDAATSAATLSKQHLTRLGEDTAYARDERNAAMAALGANGQGESLALGWCAPRANTNAAPGATLQRGSRLESSQLLPAASSTLPMLPLHRLPEDARTALSASGSRESDETALGGVGRADDSAGSRLPMSDASKRRQRDRLLARHDELYRASGVGAVPFFGSGIFFGASVPEAVWSVGTPVASDADPLMQRTLSGGMRPLHSGGDDPNSKLLSASSREMALLYLRGLKESTDLLYTLPRSPAQASTSEDADPEGVTHPLSLCNFLKFMCVYMAVV